MDIPDNRQNQNPQNENDYSQNYNNDGFGTGQQNYQQRDQSIIRWMEDISDQIIAISNWLEGKSVSITADGEELWTLAEGSKPILNAQGRSAFISGLIFLVNKNLAMGNIDKGQAKRSTLDAAHAFVVHFGLRFREYDLHPSDFQFICSQYRNFILIAFSRPIGAGERSGILHQIAESIHSVFGEQPQQKGFGRWL